MKFVQMSSLAAAVVVGLASCTDSATSALFDIVSDSTVNADIATNAGDALAIAIENMAANEVLLALPGSSANFATAAENSLTVGRTRTCYDAGGATVTGCSPLASVRRVVTLVTLDGSRSGSSTTNGTTKSWTGAVHRISNDTLVRNFNTAQPPVETSRTHSDLTVGHDTTTFSESDVTRLATEASRDSIAAVTWNVPRSSNPFPVSGSITRVATVHVTVSKGSRTESRDFVRTIRVDFPADAQGNVVLTINAKTCNLNLVTHVVSNCQ